MEATRRGLLLAAAAFTCWGLLSPGNEILLRDYGPLWMQTARALVATVVLFVLWGRERLTAAVQLIARPRVLAILMTGTVLSFALFAFAQTRVSAAITTLGFYTSPLWTAAAGRIWLGERVGPWFLPAAGVLLLGGWLALTGGGALPVPDAWGLLFAIGAGATWGLYAVGLREVAPRADWRDLLVASMLLGTIWFSFAAFLFEPAPAFSSFPASAWIWTLIQVAIPTLAALALFQTALRTAPAAQVNILVAFELGATLVFASILLGARFSLVQWVGMAVAMAAVSGYLWERAMARRRLRRLATAPAG